MGPLHSLEINTRQSIAALSTPFPHLRRGLRGLFQGIDDAARVLKTLLLGRGNTDDAIAVSTAISVWPFVRTRLSLE
jgi:DNA mismatch repair ATPase MutS